MNEFFTLFTRSDSSKVTIKNENSKDVLYLCYVLALLWEYQQIQARVTQEQQEIFDYGILRPMTSEHLPKIMYLEQVTPLYRPCYLSVLSNNNFAFMEIYT